MPEFKIPSFEEHINEAKSLGKRGMVFKNKADELFVYDRVFRGNGPKNPKQLYVFFKYVPGMKINHGHGPGGGSNTETVNMKFDGLTKVSDSLSKYEKAKAGIDVEYLESWKKIQKRITGFIKNITSLTDEYDDPEYMITSMHIFFKNYVKDPQNKISQNRIGAIVSDGASRKVFRAKLEEGTNEKTQVKIDKIAKKLLKDIFKFGNNRSLISKAFDYEMRYMDEKEKHLAYAAINIASKDIAKINIITDGARITIEEIHDVSGDYTAAGHFTHSTSYVGGKVYICGKTYDVDKTEWSSHTDVHQSYWN